MSRVGLGRFGVLPPTVVRGIATDRDGHRVCAECGFPVGQSKGSHRIAKPEVVDDLAEEIGDELITHGWKCERHTSDVVMPTPTDADAGNLPDGWTGVRLRHADGRVRHVPVPERELPVAEEST